MCSHGTTQSCILKRNPELAHLLDTTNSGKDSTHSLLWIKRKRTEWVLTGFSVDHAKSSSHVAEHRPIFEHIDYGTTWDVEIIPALSSPLGIFGNKHIFYYVRVCFRCQDEESHEHQRRKQSRQWFGYDMIEALKIQSMLYFNARISEVFLWQPKSDLTNWLSGFDRSTSFIREFNDAS